MISMTSQSSGTTAYRPDIDGLRAISVLSVIIFHLSNAILPGGFVGVDIFFVISGFLITRNILVDIERRTFSIADFYRRRVKRIMPVMLVVVGVTIVVAQFLFLPEDARDVAKSALWSLGSLANVYFFLYQDNGYFAAGSGQLPLLHLWSLGIEEQFYLLWPIFLVLLCRGRYDRRFFLFASAVTVGSFAMGSLLFAWNPSFVYYMLHTRAGELLLGALVAKASLLGYGSRMHPNLAAALSSIGMALVGAALILTTKEMQYPGLLAVPPTLGAALLILAGEQAANPIARALALRPLVWVGLISYSAYLWHWPLLVFYRYGYGELTMLAGVALFVVIILVAWCSYRYIELPARGTKASALKVFVQDYGAPASALGIATLFLIFVEPPGFPLHSDEYVRHLEELRVKARPAYVYDYVCQRQRLRAEDAVNESCVLGVRNGDQPVALLWGDSNAAHYIGVIAAIAEHSGFRFRNLEVGRCPPVLTDPLPFVEAARLVDCRDAKAVVQPALATFPIVMISAAWTSYQRRDPTFLSTFFRTVETLVREGKRVVVIGKAPEFPAFDRRCGEKSIKYPGRKCSNVASMLDAETAAANKELRDFAARTPGVTYFDVVAYLCPEDFCSPTSGDGHVLYYDSSHLSMTGSWYLGREIVNQVGTPIEFRTAFGPR
jgi:peptidoglycan/LPS O-acetylase OafA/YrhL